MKKKHARRRGPLQNGARVGSNHPLVGTWQQEPNSAGTTTVVYTVFAKQGKLGVIGSDGEDGTALKISQAKWDGESLRFTSLYPLTKHKSKHVLRVLSKGRMSHDVDCTLDDGVVFSDREVWRKKREKKKHGNIIKT